MDDTETTKCNDICLEIWEWCAVTDAWITCSRAPGKFSMADAAFRGFNDKHEWKLNYIFGELCGIFGVQTIDLFASRLNNIYFAFVPGNLTQKQNTWMLSQGVGHSST